MKLNFKIPFRCHIKGPTPDSLKLKASFIYSHYKIGISFLPPLDKKPIKIADIDDIDSDKKEIFSFDIQSIMFSIEPLSSDNNSLESFRKLCLDKKNREKLFSLLIEITNRTLHCIKYFGLAYQIKTINPPLSEAASYMKFWGVKFSKKGKTHPLIEDTKISLTDYFAGLERPLSSSRYYASTVLNAELLPDVEEALQDNIELVPEIEFLVNTLEFLGLRNFRMAIVESVISLEIAMAQYLRLYLKMKKKLSKERIKKFLNPNLGLTARVSALLNLTLDEANLKDININKVLRSIKWRNYIVHGTGHLPYELRAKELGECINEVISLSFKLSKMKMQIETEPALKAIAKEISNSNKMPMPYIKLIDIRSVVVEVPFSPKEDLPEKSVLKSFSKQLGEKLKERDPRFNMKEHLFIKFYQSPHKVRARWRNGNLEIIGTIN